MMHRRHIAAALSRRRRRVGVPVGVGRVGIGYGRAGIGYGRYGVSWWLLSPRIGHWGRRGGRHGSGGAYYGGSGYYGSGSGYDPTRAATGGSGYNAYASADVDPDNAYILNGAYISESDAVAYCAQRFRSYDIGSRTFLAYSGERVSCPQ